MVDQQLIKEILIEILDGNNGWLTKHDIIEIIKEKYSSLKKYKTSMNFVLKFHCDVFINNNKDNTFKLVKSASQDDVIKCMTMRKLIYDFLDKNENPKDINEITEYVKQYKLNTLKKSILSTLGNYKNKDFIYFENNKFGILSKTYKEEYVTKQKKAIKIIKTHRNRFIFRLISELLVNEEEPVQANKIIENVLLLQPEFKRERVLINLWKNKAKLKYFKNAYFGLATKEYSGKWVEIDKAIKEKSILELTTEYLTNEQLPKHLSEITDYVLNVRPKILKYSVLQSLRNKNNSTIIVFENNFYGLAPKTYSSDYISYNPRNRKQITMAIIDYLNNEDQPKSYPEICEYVNISFQYTNKIEIKYKFLNKSETITRFENKLYGIATKKYSNEFVEKKEDFKKESIHQLAYDYLSNEDTPIHKSEINNYVLQYKPNSNRHSVYTTLKYYEYKMFKYFKNDYIGIINKEYSKDYKEVRLYIKNKKTIINIIYAFLQQEQCPVLSKTIVAYVLQQIPSVETASIKHILRLENERLVYFKNKYIGIKSKEYAVEFIEKEKNERT